MSRVVLDASALLAVLHAERGAEKMTPALLAAALISAVNLAEVQTKLVSRGVRPGPAWDAVLSVVGEVVPFSKEHARKAGDLALQTRPLGLGLGDRACLALALSLGLPVYTADASWSRLKIGATIHVIR